jgi:hypothetical protein
MRNLIYTYEEYGHDSCATNSPEWFKNGASLLKQSSPAVTQLS